MGAGIDGSGLGVGARLGGIMQNRESLSPLAEALAPLLERFASLTVSQTGKVTSPNGLAGANNVPELEEADQEAAAKADLEALVAYLVMEQDEAQMEATKKRIDTLKKSMEANHKDTLDKIGKSIEEARKQEKAAKAQKVLGWLGVVFSFVAAVVLTVVTGGAAAAFAWAGFAIALTSQVLNETGAAKAITKAIAKSLMENNPDMKKAEAEAWASGIYGGIFLVLGLGTSIAGGFAAGSNVANVAQTTAKTVKILMQAGNAAMTAANMAATGVGTAFSYTAQNAQADVTETNKTLVRLQKAMEENQEELMKILESLNGAISDLAELLEAKSRSLNEIAQQIGAMA